MPEPHHKRTRHGELLREYRRRAALTQEELASQSGVSVRTISNIERGRSVPQASTVRALGDVLELTPTERAALLSDEPDVYASPRMLPAAPRQFVGRRHQLSLLDQSLANGDAAIVVLSGTGGVGKTWLAEHWAHQVADRFPDGQLFMSLRGFDGSPSPVEPNDAIRGLLNALGVPPDKVPATPEAQSLLYRELIAGKRMLIVLDDARDSAQVRSLLPHEPKCLVVVTSRADLRGLLARNEAVPIPCGPFTPDDARQLFIRRLGDRHARLPTDTLAKINAWCCGLPLALAIVAARAASAIASAPNADTPLAEVAATLSAARDRLTALSAPEPDTDLRSVFSWSYDTIAVDSARLFRLLGLHPGPDISLAATASLAGESKARARTLLTELATASLVEEFVPGRYRLHDLLHSYAAELAEDIDAEDERRAAHRRMLDHYLHSGFNAAQRFNPHRQLITLDDPLPGCTPEFPADHGQANQWFTAERSVLLSIIEYSIAPPHGSYTWRISWTLADYFDRQGHWHDLAAIQLRSLAAAGQLQDPLAKLSAHNNLARAYLRLCQYDSAKTHLLAGLQLNVDRGNARAQAASHKNLSFVLEKTGQYEGALAHARESVRLYELVGNQLGQARALNSVGWLSSLLGDYTVALTACKKALELHQPFDHLSSRAAIHDSLGRIYRGLGDTSQSVDNYQRAIRLAHTADDRYSEASAFNGLGDTHQTVGDTTAARRAWRQALDILTDLDHPDAVVVQAKLA